jgi:hypothetical protein
MHGTEQNESDSVSPCRKSAQPFLLVWLDLGRFPDIMGLCWWTPNWFERE